MGHGMRCTAQDSHFHHKLEGQTLSLSKDYRIEATGDTIYIGNDLPNEYTGSVYTYKLKGAAAKAKFCIFGYNYIPIHLLSPEVNIN